MGQRDNRLRILILDSDEAFRSEMQSLAHPGVEVAFPDSDHFAELKTQLTDRDVVVVCVDCPVGLALVADLCARPGAPPVLAIGAAGFDNKSLEHVLILAEMRGAVASLPKPIEAPELVLVATHIQRRLAGCEKTASATHAPQFTRQAG